MAIKTYNLRLTEHELNLVRDLVKDYASKFERVLANPNGDLGTKYHGQAAKNLLDAIEDVCDLALLDSLGVKYDP